MVSLGQQGGPLGKWGLRFKQGDLVLRFGQNPFTGQGSSNIGSNQVMMASV
jgi:hypothetical protein